MDCQEWKDKDLNEGYKKFAKDLNKVMLCKVLAYTKMLIAITIVPNGSGNSMLCI